eukprot:TRINITY_DN6230_c0_g1_i1.p1 TRINITY_DN6230_c0_g1~~TRINITY_DN6230_c0_g1_i1.p1  ORF type:complete len:1045 (-),score=188.38 TRINITY_DN6230_c0_g1_i1:192-3326(-)
MLPMAAPRAAFAPGPARAGASAGMAGRSPGVAGAPAAHGSCAGSQVPSGHGSRGVAGPSAAADACLGNSSRALSRSALTGGLPRSPVGSLASRSARPGGSSGVANAAAAGATGASSSHALAAQGSRGTAQPRQPSSGLSRSGRAGVSGVGSAGSGSPTLQGRRGGSPNAPRSAGGGQGAAAAVAAAVGAGSGGAASASASPGGTGSGSQYRVVSPQMSVYTPGGAGPNSPNSMASRGPIRQQQLTSPHSGNLVSPGGTQLSRGSGYPSADSGAHSRSALAPSSPLPQTPNTGHRKLHSTSGPQKQSGLQAQRMRQQGASGGGGLSSSSATSAGARGVPGRQPSSPDGGRLYRNVSKANTGGLGRVLGSPTQTGGQHRNAAGTASATSQAAQATQAAQAAAQAAAAQAAAQAAAAARQAATHTPGAYVDAGLHDMSSSMLTVGSPLDQSMEVRAPLPPEQQVSAASAFLDRALRDEHFARALLSGPRMDVALYWEKRRVQSTLRRVVEAMQEHFRLDGEMQTSELDGVYDLLRQHAGVKGECIDEQRFTDALEAYGLWPPELSAADRNEVFVSLLVPSAASARALFSGQRERTYPNRKAFSEAFDRLPYNLPDFPVPMHLLAPGLEPNGDRRFTPEQRNAVAVAIATTFSLPQTGLGKVKDFYLTGLLSLEEIQRALPKLVPRGLVEEAIVQIIRVGASYFEHSEWQDLVFNVRTKEACGHTVEASTTLDVTREEPQDDVRLNMLQSSVMSDRDISLASPPPQQREVLLDNSSSGNVGLGVPAQAAIEIENFTCGGAMAGAVGSTSGFHSGGGHRRTEQEDFDHRAGMRQGRQLQQPVTEPLPSRGLRSEDPVLNFATHAAAAATAANGGAAGYAIGDAAGTGGHQRAGSGGIAPPKRQPLLNRLVDWSTASGGSGGSGGVRGHQADEGAGARSSWGTRGFKQEMAAAQARSRHKGCDRDGDLSGISEVSEGPEPVAWMDLELHHECGGPYLANAFVRCCQLYESRRRREVRTGIAKERSRSKGCDRSGDLSGISEVAEEGKSPC